MTIRPSPHRPAAVLVAAACALVPALAAAQASTTPPPCAEDPDYRQLDYLVGEWEAHRRDGDKIADVSLAPQLDRCAVSFAWNPVKADAQHGSGFFTYSRLRGTPMFFYAGDKGGDTAAVRAEAQPGDITFIIEYPGASGPTVRRFRLARQADGSILETSRISENGAPFKQTFEAVWKKKKP